MQISNNGTELDRIEPFLKWAGGKRWLVKRNENIIPEKFNRYIEPFLGGAAVLFSIRDIPFIVSDINKELIDCYLAIRDDHIKIEKYLEIHQRLHSKEYYYQIRSSKPRTLYTKAAKFIYLNRTCWNGLYRVNLKGDFNVPIGTKKNVILNSDDFLSVSNKLRNGKILCQDFGETLNQADKGDFVFIDPPYTVKHNYNGFIKYNEKIFSWEDQVKLRGLISDALDRGVMITMTNADHESIKSLYSGMCRIESVKRNSVIAGSSVHRGITSEVLMRFGWGD